MCPIATDHTILRPNGAELTIADLGSRHVCLVCLTRYPGFTPAPFHLGACVPVSGAFDWIASQVCNSGLEIDLHEK